MRRNVKVVPVIDVDGIVLYTVPRATAIDQIKLGRAHSVKGRAIRLIDPVRASSSQRSKSALTMNDAEALAGAEQMSTRQRERIAGWELARRGQL